MRTSFLRFYPLLLGFYITSGQLALAQSPGALEDKKEDYLKAQNILVGIKCSPPSKGTTENARVDGVLWPTLVQIRSFLNLYYPTSVCVTGGNERGHCPESGSNCAPATPESKTHAKGFKIDLRKSDALSSYILQPPIIYLGLRNGQDPWYETPSSGVQFAVESSPPHWDVKSSYASLNITDHNLSIQVGNSLTIDTKAKDSYGNDIGLGPEMFAYNVVGPVNIAGVDKNGLVTGQKEGSTTILVSEGFLDFVDITVTRPDPPDDGCLCNVNQNCWRWDASTLSWVCDGGGHHGRPPAGGRECSDANDSNCWDWIGADDNGYWTFRKKEDPDDGDSSSDTTTVTSYDPNDITGPLGVGGERYISSITPLRYLISFENLASATAPAQQVVISDQLDSNIFDLNTVALGPIAFGTNVVTPIGQVSSYFTQVDLRPDKNLIVMIEAGLNKATAVLTWKFTAIDPSTGAPPADAMGGFLPPNVNSPQGQGSVLWTAAAKGTLLSETAIGNSASIVFDYNAPISTPVWTNTTDNTKPESRVSPLSGNQFSMAFLVQWSGTDAGAGIRDFTIYVSDNGGSFTPWFSDTTKTSATYFGLAGHSYSFYSVARDLVGNIEDSKTEGESSTRITPDTTPPATSAGATPSANNNGWNKDNVTVAMSATDNAGGSGVKQISYSLNGSTPTVVSGSSASVAVSQGGITSLTYFAIDNAGNQETSKALTVQIDKTAPGSHILALPATETSTSFTVQWTGTDSGSGIQDFTVYMSDSGGPFTPIQSNTTATSAIFNGQAGHSYGFHSIARDRADNAEAAKTSPEAVTTVTLPPSCAADVTLLMTITRSGYTYNFATGRFSQTVTLKNAGVSAISGPIALALDSLSPNATLYNGNGKTGCAVPSGSPFINVSTTGLNPGSSVSVVLQFTNPTKVAITYTPRALAGNGTR
jgi:hypothetical protein